MTKTPPKDADAPTLQTLAHDCPLLRSNQSFMGRKLKDMAIALATESLMGHPALPVLATAEFDDLSAPTSWAAATIVFFS